MEIKQEPDDPAYIDDKIARTREIISREFARELDERESEVVRIQEQIQSTQRLIEVFKYVASYDYYDQNDIKNEDGDAPLEYAIHPCVKKYLPNQMGPNEEPREIEEEQEFEEEASENSNKSLSKPVSKPNLNIVRGTYKVKHQLVVGNISKWIPPAAREDEATHKWMLYLRDKGRDADMANMIKKVRYFLHESYKPHDIIDVTSSPFHLTRRGWGEFPVRVTIFFQHPLNKPIDFIHNLKLDHTFAGVQMLGGETVVEVNLIHYNIDELLSQEPMKDDHQTMFSSKLEECIANEHDYCAPQNCEQSSEQTKQPYQTGKMFSHPLVNEVNVSEVEILNNWDPETDEPIVEWYNKDLIKRASNVYFFSTEACVKWLLKRWPIVTNHATSWRYKNVHPYTFSSVETFSKANAGRRRAAEWYRAWKIKNMLERFNLSPWTTKQIMLFARMHGYVIFIGRKFYNTASLRFKDFSTYSNQVDTSCDLRQLETFLKEEDIDIIGEEPKQMPTTHVKLTKHVKIISNWVKYVEDTSKKIGIRFGEEEIIEGVATNSPVVLVAHALKLFLEDLLRKSLNNSWLRNKCQNPGTLEVADILKCLVESPEFDLFTNAGLGSKDIQQ